MGLVTYKPWGQYETLDEGIDYKVKKITLNPRQRFSLQYHRYREEHWSVVSGYGRITVAALQHDAVPGSNWIIPATAIHRATAGNEEFVFIEIQIGDCYEEDIVRIEDDYNRSTPK